jgi:tellurite methyltransferase
MALQDFYRLDADNVGQSLTMRPEKEPPWEAAYRDSSSPSAFGMASEEIRQLTSKLAPGAEILDLGCGDGRNVLFLLEQGMIVTAIDISPSAIAKLRSKAAAYVDRLRTDVADARHYVPEHQFDLVIAHGILHLLPQSDWSRLILRMKAMTKPSGFNIVAVFTNSLPPPEDLSPFALGLFREGELLDQYSDWKVELFDSYIKEDQHPGSVRHRHPVNKIVAQKRK